MYNYVFLSRGDTILPEGWCQKLISFDDTVEHTLRPDIKDKVFGNLLYDKRKTDLYKRLRLGYFSSLAEDFYIIELGDTKTAFECGELLYQIIHVDKVVEINGLNIFSIATPAEMCDFWKGYGLP